MRSYLTIFMVLAFGLHAFSQNDKPFIPSEPFQISFLPMLGSGGKAGTEKSYDVSINILGGYTGAVQKLELGAFFNLNRYYMNGVQLGGFVNLTGLGNVGNATSMSSGWQLAGFVNATKGDFSGVNIAGFVNVIEQTHVNLQLAGFFNASKMTDRTTQLSGFANFSAAGETHVQATGFVNVTRDSKAAQLAGFVNVAEEASGVQIAGFVNAAHHVKGVQIGILNYSDSIDGTPIGLLNIVRKGGYRGFEFSADEVAYASGTFKIGVDHFYTLFNVSKLPGEASRWMYGFGFGTKQQLFDKFYGRVEFLARQELWLGNHNAPYAVYTDRTNMVNTLKIAFAKPLAGKSELFIAPSLNVSVSGNTTKKSNLGPDVQPYWKAPSLTNGHHNNVRMWPGISIGISL